VNISLRNVSCTGKIKPARPKRGGLGLCLLSAILLFCLLISPAAAAVEWEISPSSPTVGDTLIITGKGASPDETLTATISFEKELPVSGGKYEYSLKKIKIPEGDDNLFTVTAGGVKDLNVRVKKIIWITLQSKASDGVATISQRNVPPLTYKIQIDGNAEKKKSCVNLNVTASQTLKADSKGKFKYNYDTSSMPAGEFKITIGGVEKTIELKPDTKKACR